MPVDVVSQIIVVLVTFILSLIVCYGFFNNSFTYLMYFETFFLILFVSYNVIDFYYLPVAILFIAIILYRAIEPSFKENEK